MGSRALFRAVLALQWEARYRRASKGLPTVFLLHEGCGIDADFEKAFARLEQPGLKVLDWGCGFGELSAQAARWKFSVLGVDVASQAIARAKSHHWARCRFLHTDALEQDLGETFDIVVDRGFLAVLTASEIRHYFLRVRRYLRPRGYLLLKIDQMAMRRLPRIRRYLSRHFHEKDRWASSYLRADKVPRTAEFFILRKRGGLGTKNAKFLARRATARAARTVDR